MKLYEELVSEITGLTYDKILLEDVRDALHKLLSLFERDYFKENSDYKRIKRYHEEDKDACEKYLTWSKRSFSPDISYTIGEKRPEIGLSYERETERKDTHYNCILDADRKYYNRLYNLLKTSKDRICNDHSDKEKCKKHIEDKLRDVELNLHKISFASKYLKDKK